MKKLNKTEQWLQNNNRRSAKLRDILPTVSQYRQMDSRMKRQYTQAMRNIQRKHSPSAKANGLDKIFKLSNSIPNKTRQQLQRSNFVWANIVSASQFETENQSRDLQMGTGEAYIRNKNGFGRFGQRKLDKQGRPVGYSQAVKIKRMQAFNKLNKKSLAVNPVFMKETLEKVVVYSANDKITIAADPNIPARSNRTRYGGRIAIYNSSQTMEYINNDLRKRGYASDEIDYTKTGWE